MIQLKSAREIEIMARGGQILAAAVHLAERDVRAAGEQFVTVEDSMLAT